MQNYYFFLKHANFYCVFHFFFVTLRRELKNIVYEHDIYSTSDTNYPDVRPWVGAQAGGFDKII